MRNLPYTKLTLELPKKNREDHLEIDCIGTDIWDKTHEHDSLHVTHVVQYSNPKLEGTIDNLFLCTLHLKFF